MSSLQSSPLIFSSNSSYPSSKRSYINAAIQVPKLPKFRFTFPKPSPVPKTTLTTKPNKLAVEETDTNDVVLTKNDKHNETVLSTAKLYAVLEAVADRVEMHENMGEQRDNWNALFLNSINMITLTASTIAGVAAAAPGTSAVLALKLSSTLLFSAATGMLVVMNKLQPSQLVEEQRNASRLFRQIQTEIQTVLSLRSPTENDVKEAMQKVLTLDRAYPLPLIGAMLEKFPERFEPAVWWPRKRSENSNNSSNSDHIMMKEIVEVVKRKDLEDYERLGSLALKINKALAFAGPLLTGVAAVSAPFIGDGGSWGAVTAVTAGALAGAVNSFQHGGQVGMVFEMYRNCAGFFKLLEETIEEERESVDSEVFEMKVALQLGRSLSELEELAAKSAASRANGTAIDEFASKLF
ncbi:hypothetical protein L484_014189 [Morus notabilis]|uniref:F-box protein n=1 Tax=Morus notabilis TaxID=981085 RepID=W9RHG7_9ROSA|nr:probable F-box protein At4g22030 [Morus notabilis]EXB77062.1 hypothetical protein L484_014189 [Morus notabilis]